MPRTPSSTRRAGLLLKWAAIALAAAGIGCTDPEVAKLEYLDSGDAFMADGEVQEAILEYRNALQQDPAFGEARWRLAQAYLAQQNPAALVEYVRAADLLPDNKEVQLGAATLLVLAERFEDADARAGQLLELDPSSVDARMVRAAAMAGLDDVDGAIALLEEATMLDASDGRPYMMLGRLRFQQGDEAAAELDLRSAKELAPDSIEAQLALANFYWSAGRIEEAEGSLHEALEMQPDNLIANQALATLYSTTDRAAEAERLLQAAADTGNADARASLADYYLRVQRPDDASPLLTELAGTPDRFVAATLRLAQVDHDAGRTTEAFRKLEQVLEQAPRNAIALGLQAEWELEAGNVDAALQAAQASAAAAPTSAAAYVVQARAVLATGRRADAVAALNEALRLDPEFVPALVLRARIALGAGDPGTALSFAQQAKRLQPNDAEAQIALARSLAATGDLTGATTEVQAVLARFPGSSTAHVTNAQILFARGDAPGARAAFERALELNPADLEALEGLFALDVNGGTLDAAVARVEASLASDDSAALHFLAARTYGRAGQTAQAEQELLRTIALAPDNVEAYTMLGRLYIAQARSDEAVEVLDRATERRPDDSEPATIAAMYLQGQGRTDEARRRYQAILAANPRAGLAANNLAWLNAEDGDLDEALRLAQVAKAELPNAPAVDDTLGWVYLQRNLPDLAIPPLERATQAASDNATYHYHLGLAYEAGGRAADARVELERALALDPAFDGAADARRVLGTLRE